MLAIITLVLCKIYYRKKAVRFMDNFVSWITQDNLTAAVCSRGCDCKLIGQVYADRSETVTGSNSLTRNILSNNLCQGSWSPGLEFNPPDWIFQRIQSPGPNFPGNSIPREIQSPGSNLLGNSIPPGSNFPGNSIPHGSNFPGNSIPRENQSSRSNVRRLSCSRLYHVPTDSA